MDITKLESFLILAKTQHFAKAADKLYISQPALSKRIKALEDELGVPLFNRMGNHTFLTIHGEAFRPFAENMVATCNSAKEYIRQIENMEHGVLNFGATNFIGVYMLPAVIARFHQKYPNITINMNINTSQTILEMLHKNQLEFVFVSDYIIADPENYEIEHYWQDSLKLIVGSSHPLFGKKNCSFSDVQNDLYITKKKQSSQYKFLDHIFHRYNVEFPNKLFISTQDAIKEAVVNNVGISIMSELAVEREVNAGLITALDFRETPILRNIQYAYLKNKYLTPAAKAFLQML
ncbi:MAG: LysR family transcriptional regulator [Lachnospiraceae bacterium]|jgi:DNA-binding transcriptional LysR family regulator